MPHAVQNVSMAGIAFNLILIRVGQERTNRSNVEEYSQNTGPPPSELRFRSATVTSPQAQTCNTACPGQDDRTGLYIMAKADLSRIE